MSSFISSIGTALPPHKLDQSTVAEFMIRHLPLSEQGQKEVRVLYRASGIKNRYSVIPDFGGDQNSFQFFPKNDALEPFPTVGERMGLYKNEAIKLCRQAVTDCIADEQLNEITHLITVSCTGMYAPGIDIELIESLELPTTTQRTAINFMGCYAAFNALKVADQIVKNDPKHKVLIVAVELCSIHLLKQTDEDSLLSNALFGDGAAAVLVEAQQDHLQLELASFYADLDLSGKNEMAWHISDFGFQMKLSREVPEVIKKGIVSLTQKLLDQISLKSSDIEYYAIHPGGKRILEVIEESLELSKSQNEAAYHVLKNNGNMSSPTVLFVLKRIMEQLSSADRDKHILSFAFGPGLTMESMLLKINYGPAQ